MKKVIIIAVISFLAVAGAICLDFSKDITSIEEIRTYDSGYEEGKSIGIEIGYENGYDEGHYDGHSEGYDDGYDQGYFDGESAGYYDGATYTCLFYGDVDKAFKSAKNGTTWYTFVDAYDEFISNIYDDDETRSNIVWSLVSATTSDVITNDEVELLTTTFGEDLFIRNGVKLTEGR